MKKLFFLSVSLLCAMTTVVGLTACSDDDKETDSKQNALVAILKNADFDYWHQIAEGFSEECENRGLVPLVYYTPDEENSKAQVDIVNGLENSEYDIQGIAFAPIWTENDRQAEQAVASFASKHGIPVTVVDSPIDSETSPLKDVYVSYVGTDNRTAGQELAGRISGSAESILVVRDENSTPTLERYQGLCAGKGQELKLWNTSVSGVKDIAGQIDEQVGSIVFLNGHLCREVLNEIGVYDVYTFDIYNEYAPLLDEETFLKGVVAQNTLEMGHMCVADLLSAPQSKEHFIPTIYCDYEFLKKPSEYALPLLNFLRQNSPFNGKSVLLTLGNKDYLFWQQMESGAEEKAGEMGVELHTCFGETETDTVTCPNAIANCAEIPNLIGVAGQINRKAYDDACAYIPDGVNLTLIEGICYEGGISEKRYNGIVSLNNAHYAKEFLSHIPDGKLLVLSYSTGNNRALTKEYIRLRGADNIRPVYFDETAFVLDSLKNFNLDDYEAVIFNSGNFVSEECMNYLSGKNVFSSDLNDNVAGYIRSGAIALNISPDTYKFGRLVLLSAVTGANYEVPFIITTAENIDSPEREKYLKK